MGNRLTRKRFTNYDMPIGDEDIAIHKLGQLEDIEEELGIDLITLFKALKNGVYSNHYAYAGEEIHKIDVELEKRPYGFCVSGGFGEGHNLKDYGKTWALTKEELEVENYGAK